MPVALLHHALHPVTAEPRRRSSLHLRVLDGRAPSHPTESCDSAGTPREALKPASPPARARSYIYVMRSLPCSSSPWLRPPMPRICCGPPSAGPLGFLGWSAQPAHQLFEQLASFRIRHQPLLHLLCRAADLGVGEQPLGHRLEARGYVLHRRFLGHLDQDRLAGGGAPPLPPGADPLGAPAAPALSFEAAIA